MSGPGPVKRVDLGDAVLADVLTPADAQKLWQSARRLGRNDPCFCGSGRKFKHCHYNQLRSLAGRG